MIEFKNVTKRYSKDAVALENVNLTIGNGEFVYIIGESGAGKTTLTKLLLREEKVTSGSILVDGKALRKLNFFTLPYYRRKIGFVFQDFRLFEHMTVYENVAFAMRAVGARRSAIREKVPLILDVCNLSTMWERFPDELSGGEQQRVALARALANNPKYIIADEPTGNIDPAQSKIIMDMFLKICDMGKTVIVVTHEREPVSHTDRRVITFSKGHIVSDTAAERTAVSAEAGK